MAEKILFKKISRAIEEVIDRHVADLSEHDKQNVKEVLLESVKETLNQFACTYEKTSSIPMAKAANTSFDGSCDKCKRPIGAWRHGNGNTEYDGNLMRDGVRIIII